MKQMLWIVALALAITAPAAAQLSPAAPPSTPEPPAFLTQGPQQVGEEVRLELESAAWPGSADDRPEVAWSEELTMPDATYIAPHFSHFDLPPGAELTVRAPDGSRSWTYRGYGKADHYLEDGFWGIHIAGERAIVELRSPVPLPRGAVVIDRFAHGYPAWHFVPPGPESICGVDDSREAKCYQSSNPTIYSESRAVARLLINGTSLCTGWLIGSQGHLMTNNHCIGSSSSALNTDYEFLAEGASCSTNCRGTLACPGTVAATSATFIQTDTFLDYTLVQLPTNVSSTYGYMQLRDGSAQLGERIYLPGHPAGWGKQLAVESTHSLNPTGFCEVDSLNESPCIGGSVPEVGYYCDTQGGSSGSPVLATSDHCVVALHHCRGSFACTGSGGDPNRGVPVGSIISDLGSNLPAGALCGGGGPALASGTETIDEVIRTVSLSGFSTPVVVMGPPSFAGGNPSTIRVRNVTTSSFQHDLQEWDYLDGLHVNESIGYLALEQGASTLGSLDAEAGRVNINHNWTTVSFNQSFASAPVVVAQVGTFNGNQAVTTRVRGVNASGFEIRLQEEEGNDGTHAVETVHWIAIETGSTSVGGNTLVVGRTGNSVTHAWATINFGQSLSSPAFLAEMQTFDGGDAAALRHRSLGASSVEVKVEEEQSLDSETNHTTEVIGWIAIGQ